MKNGNILIITGIMHFLFGVSPLAFGKQFANFADKFFINISGGIFEFPLFNGNMNYETMTAFWFVYFGLLLIPIGILVNYIEKSKLSIPTTFVWSYFLIVMVGVLMIPYSGMTLFMLPHALYLLWHTKVAKSDEQY